MLDGLLARRAPLVEAPDAAERDREVAVRVHRAGTPRAGVRASAVA